MRFIEHRRHTMRTKPGQDLSQAGVDLARRTGTDLGPFDLVVTSIVPRAFQTAIAMGFAVDRQAQLLALFPDGVVADELSWSDGFERFAEVVATHPDGATASYARQLAQLHAQLAGELPEDGSALVISHGGIVEASAVGCLPDHDVAAWGSCDYCEGVRFRWQGGACAQAERLRVTAT